MSNRSHAVFNGLYWLTVVSLAVLIGLLAFRVWALALPMEETFSSHLIAAATSLKEYAA